MTFHNKTILITGGTGSFGQKFAHIVYHTYKPKALRIFSRGEYIQYQMAQKYRDDKHNRMRFLIGDVRDKERLYRAMNGVDIVIHAAALKQIVAAEYNPIEAVRTNINGTMNVIDAAIDNNVERAILISTDKAVNPVNLYGATKLCAEKLFIQANSYTGERKTMFSCVRYGNVVGSRGSVIPLFLHQAQEGMLTVTHPDMTRFWITLEQGVEFVIKSIDRMRGGEIFVPKIPSVQTIQLAKMLAPNAKIKIVGMRAGEKLHEVLISKEEARHTKEFKDYFVIEPEHSFWNRNNHKAGKSLPADFEYVSDTNKQTLQPTQIWKMLKDLEIPYEALHPLRQTMAR